MLDAYCIDKPCSIEDAVRTLRGLVHVLAQEPERADDLVEASLTELLSGEIAFDPDAVDLRILFQPLRKKLSALPASRQGAGANPADQLPYMLREALVLHRSAGMGLAAIGVLVGEPAGVIRQRVKEAERMICNHCPAFCLGPIAA